MIVCQPPLPFPQFSASESSLQSSHVSHSLLLNQNLKHEIISTKKFFLLQILIPRRENQNIALDELEELLLL
jgi:hypothetical protein